jgi:hypothetical protein
MINIHDHDDDDDDHHHHHPHCINTLGVRVYKRLPPVWLLSPLGFRDVVRRVRLVFTETPSPLYGFYLENRKKQGRSVS